VRRTIRSSVPKQAPPLLQPVRALAPARGRSTTIRQLLLLLLLLQALL
jgi:hypothetical protein